MVSTGSEACESNNTQLVDYRCEFVAHEAPNKTPNRDNSDLIRVFAGDSAG